MAETSTAPVITARRGRATLKMMGRGAGLYPIIAFVVLWELVSRYGDVPSVLLPPFSTVVVRLAEMTVNGEILKALLTTAGRAGAGLLIAGITGVVVGLAMARLRPAEWFFEPLIAIGFPTPTITLLPVFILWFGTGHASKVLLVALSCFFPIALSTYNGAKQVNPKLIWSAQAMGTRGHELFRRVIVPASVAFMFAGLRVAVPLAVIITVLSEMVGGGGGLGYTLVFAYRFLQSPTAFAALLAVLLFGLVIDRALLTARRKLLPWDDGAQAPTGR